MRSVGPWGRVPGRAAAALVVAALVSAAGLGPAGAVADDRSTTPSSTSPSSSSGATSRVGSGGGGGVATSSSPQGGATVRLVRQTPWVVPGEPMQLVLRLAGVADPGALELAVTAHQRIATRADLAKTSLGDGLRSVLWQPPGGAVPLASLPVAPDGTVTVEVPTQDPKASADRSRLRLAAPGAYPVHVELRGLDGGDTVDRFTTHLLHAPANGPRLKAALLLPLSAPPSIDADGRRRGPPAGASAIADAAAGLADEPLVPLTLVPSPETLEGLAATAPVTVQALVNGLAERPALARPYVPLVVPALGDVALPALQAALDAGRAASEAALRKAPVAGTWVADEALDTPSVGAIAASGARRLVVPQAMTGDAGLDVPIRPVTLTAGDLELAALVADGTIGRRLADPVPSIDQPLLAHHVLAELFAIAVLPTTTGVPAPTTDDRVATVLPSRRFLPTRAFLEQLLAGLRRSPVVDAVDLDAAFALADPLRSAQPAGATTSTTRGRRRATTTTTLGPSARTLVPAPPEAVDRRLGPVLGPALRDVTAHAQVLAPAEGPAAVPDEEAPLDLRRQLLVACSADLAAEEGRRRLLDLRDDARGELGRISVPTERSLRLTARSGSLPVGVLNDTGRTARVLVRLASEKLELPQGADQAVVLDRRTSTAQFAVRVRAAGRFPVRVTLLTPDGGTVLQQTDYLVTSSTVPRIAVVVSGGAVAVLVVWWLKTLLPGRGRHSRRRKDRAAT